MLNYEKPTLFELGRAVEKLSTKSRQPVYHISKTDRFKSRRDGTFGSGLAPGQYKIESMWPADSTEVLATKLTRARSAPKFSFTRDRRMDENDCLKGISAFYGSPNKLGPGQYHTPQMGSRTYKHTAPSYTI
mmetsp:Transcript_97707/g.203897  ORF Transcript_97707/g.203897 Transcript_97707/m.203897 type:complete len:132 (+) Transcript_97707:283-678(+)